VPAKSFTMYYILFQMNAVLLNFLFSKESWNPKIHIFHKNIK